MKSDRRRSYQYGTVRLRERAKEPAAWTLMFRRYNNDNTSEQATEIFADQSKYPTEAEALASDELETLRKRVNQYNKVACSVVFFTDLCDEYRNRHLSTVRPKVAKGYRTNLAYLEAAFGDWRLDQLGESLAEVQEWINSNDLRSVKTKEPLALQTRKHIARLLSNTFCQGMMWKYVRHNPWNQLRVRKGARPVALDFDIEREMYWFLIDDPQTPRHVRMMIIIAMLTGLRIEEIIALKWSDLDFRRGLISIERTWVDGVLGEPKTEASGSRVPMAPGLVKELKIFEQEYLSINGWLFESAVTKMPLWSGTVQGDYLRPALNRMGEALGVFIPRGTGFHAFRHTFITSLDVHGSTLKVAQSLARHASEGMTLKYINKGRRHHEQMRRASYAIAADLERTGTDGD